MGWIDWKLVLDINGGPNHVKNYVSAPIIADFARDELLFLSSFFYIGQVSRYILPGARRILSASNRDALEVVAFQNADGTIAIVVLNQTDQHIPFTLYYGGSSTGCQTEAPAHSITTFTVLTALCAL